VNEEERIAFIALHNIEGVGDVTIRQLISYCGSPNEVFKLPKRKLLKIPGIGEVTANSIQTGKYLQKAEEEIKKALKDNTKIYLYTDPEYPTRLKNIGQAPAMLYLKGDVDLNYNKIIAIVGTRQATKYGKDAITEIIEGLVAHKPIIISGLAYGIDIHSHQQALTQGLQTIAVLGSGMDVIYPNAHLPTAKKIVTQGGLVTEQCYGSLPEAHFFPARNRIIAGMCDGLIVAESAEKGGAIITANLANEYNKDVFAIPGNIGNKYSTGCNKLIKTLKANLLTSVEDIEYIMNWNKNEEKQIGQLELELIHFDNREQIVIDKLNERNGPTQIDELCIKTGFSHGELASILLSLEIKNVISSLPGKSYQVAHKFASSKNT